MEKLRKSAGETMFDPTIYENLKVVLEGAVYERDLAGTILVTNRKDVIDLATLSRSFEIEFRLRERGGDKPVHASLFLSASAADLAGEILEEKTDVAWGCLFEIRFSLVLPHPKEDCHRIHSIINKIWGGRPAIHQTLSYPVNVTKEHYQPEIYFNEVILDFGRKVGEDQIDDMQHMIGLTLESLKGMETAFITK